MIKDQSRKAFSQSEEIKLADLINMEDPQQILEEVCVIARRIIKDIDLGFLTRVFGDIQSLFKGEYLNFRRCNTNFHDLQHTTDCFLAMSRLIHGASVTGIVFDEREVIMGLVTALMHDTGYIQEKDDTEASGGTYTLVHVDRSIDFMKKYFEKEGIGFSDFELCRRCVKCTGLDVKIHELSFESRNHEMLGKMLGTADLIGQISARTYLEKLVFLYREFEEAGVKGFVDEFDLLKKTGDFYQTTRKRLLIELEAMSRYVRYHFRDRWNIDADLYNIAMDRNINKLKYILDTYGADYRPHLRRGNFFT